MPSTPWKLHPPVARIAEIVPDSIADELGLLPGDVICAINGQPLTDYIAYRFAIAEEELVLDVMRGEERVEMEIEKDADEDLGLIFEGDVFDGVRPCRNNCVFCFEAQMPAGMRPSLNLRDDDYRLSFIHGNFLTLTNLRDGDMERIVHEHLSPLFVSVHATDTTVRRRMLRNRNAPDIRDQLRQLGDGGIEVHAQIVLCPGWNDGAVLEETLGDLAALYPTVLTVGIVPVGLTEHRPTGSDVRAVTPDDARAVLETVERVQQRLLPALGTRQVFAADEFYLATGHTLPPAEAYEGFPQKENGIGLARLFLDEVEALALPVTPPNLQRITLVTGTLAAPLVEMCAARLRQAWGITVQVIPVQNAFYGGGVSVAGLLTGQNVLEALGHCDLGQALFLPAAMCNADGIFLDDMTPDALEDTLGLPVFFCSGPDEILETLLDVFAYLSHL